MIGVVVYSIIGVVIPPAASPAYVWLPVTIILWPWSAAHSVVDFYCVPRGL